MLCLVKHVIRQYELCHEKTDLKIFVIVIPKDGLAGNPSFGMTTTKIIKINDKDLMQYLQIEYLHSSVRARNADVLGGVLDDRLLRADLRVIRVIMYCPSAANFRTRVHFVMLCFSLFQQAGTV